MNCNINIKHMEKNIIYRVFDSKKRYRQSYSAKLKGSFGWAVDCANSEKGFIYEDTINQNLETVKSKLVYPEERNKK
ncbi:MAG: hypothetical protein HWN81_05815 [Candidatus Lokiarchaeota archaeon]|nr:hypothetical protein [Candidatus Lokiarchaeota archaeon]